MKLKYFLTALLFTPTFAIANAQLSCGALKEDSEGMSSSQTCTFRNGSINQAFLAFGKKEKLWQPLIKSGLPTKNSKMKTRIKGLSSPVAITVTWKGKNQVDVSACQDESDYCTEATFTQKANNVIIKTTHY